MAFREVSVNEIREVLRVWLGVAGLPAPGYRTIASALRRGPQIGAPLRGGRASGWFAPRRRCQRCR